MLTRLVAVFFAGELDAAGFLVVFFGDDDPAFDDDSDETFFANGIVYGLINKLKNYSLMPKI